MDGSTRVKNVCGRINESKEHIWMDQENVPKDLQL